MKRGMFVVLCLACAVGAAWGGEVLKDDEGRVLVPVAKLNCAPLFEVKDVRMTLCRVAGSKEFAILTTVTFTHNATSSYDVTATCNFGPLALFRQNVLSTVCEAVKPKTLTQARFIAGDPKWSEQSRSIHFTPNFTFSFGRK